VGGLGRTAWKKEASTPATPAHNTHAGLEKRMEKAHKRNADFPLEGKRKQKKDLRKKLEEGMGASPYTAQGPSKVLKLVCAEGGGRVGEKVGEK